jgi:hypothetical protein
VIDHREKKNDFKSLKRDIKKKTKEANFVQNKTPTTRLQKMSWFASVASSFTSGKFSELAEKVSQTVTNAAAELMSLDKLQDEFGDKDGKKALYSGLDITFVLPRIAAMGFPCTRTSKIRSKNDIDAVASYLKERAGGISGHVLVWNLSEETYDTTPFDGNCVDVKFSGQPCPPLVTIFKICAASEAWLLSDPTNIIAIHCMTGRGRTSLVCACLLAYLAGQGEAPVEGGANEVLKSISTARGVSVEELCAPSQIRYIQYFGLILDSVKLRQHADGGLLLRRVIFNGVPDLTKTIDEAYASLEKSAAAAEKLKEAASVARAANSPEAAAAAASISLDTESEERNIKSDNQSMLGTVLAKLEKVDEATEKLEQKAIDAVVDTATSVINKAATRISNATTSNNVLNSVATSNIDNGEQSNGGCRPFVQVFVKGKLVFSTLLNDTTEETINEQHAVIEVVSNDKNVEISETSSIPKLVQPDWVNTFDGSARFSIGVPVAGDVVVRCRHLEAASYSCKNESKGNETLFRAAFHTGQLSGHVLRLTKRQLDVACSNPRVPLDFFVEIVFSPIADADPSLIFDQMSSAMSDDFKPDSIGDIPVNARIHPVLGDVTSFTELLLHETSTKSESFELFWNDLQKRKIKRAEYTATAQSLQLQKQVTELEKLREDITSGVQLSERSVPLSLPTSQSLSSFFTSSEAVIGGVSGLLMTSLSQAATTVRSLADDSSVSRHGIQSLDSSPISETGSTSQIISVRNENERESNVNLIPNSTSSLQVPSITTQASTSSPSGFSVPAEDDLDSLESFLASLATK